MFLALTHTQTLTVLMKTQTNKQTNKQASKEPTYPHIELLKSFLSHILDNIFVCHEPFIIM